jgi:hypothetical protein
VFDVSYVDFNVILDGADNLLTLSDSNNLPSKGFRTRSGNLTLDVTDVGYDFNIVAQAEIYDSRGESSKTSCGLKAFTSNSNSSSNQNESTDSTTTTIAPTTTTTTIAPTTTTTTIAPTTYPSTPSTSTWSTFNGSGDSVLDISSVGTDVMIAEVSHTGSSNFSIVFRDSGLGYQGLKVNTIGSYSGIIPINFENEVNSNLEISADGNWEIIIKQIASSTNFDGNSISGTGDTVLEAYELKSVDSLTITHSGSSNFSIVQYRCNGSYNGLLVNIIGSYSGSNITDSGTCFLEINADGSWSITK